jgi:hypothetical protein
VNITLPETVKVGPLRYQVNVEDDAFPDDTKTGMLCGQANHNDGVIRIMRGAPHRMFSTLWHEILHAVDDVAGTELTEDEVNRLAPVLASVLIDNGYVEEIAPHDLSKDQEVV